MPRRSRDRCSWWTAGTIRSSMRARGARDERHLSVVRDGVSRGPRQGPAGRSARALRGVQQRVCGQRCRRRAGRGSLRRSPAGARGVGSPGRRGAGVAIRATAARSGSGRAPGAGSAAATAVGARAPAPARHAALLGAGCRSGHAAARARSPPPPPPPPPPAAPPRPVAPPAAPAAAPPTPTLRPPASPTAPVRAPAATPPARPAAPAAAPPAPSAAPSAPPGQRMTGPLRPVNPFMVQDPKQKARRLARALVSDLVVYHPEKRQQGLRDGTLPQLFKDEIEKSWQEYVEQVGAEIAKSTSFWVEALNEILAGGNKVF